MNPTIDANKVIDIQANMHGSDKANDSKQIAILIVENQALKEEVDRLKTRIDKLTEDKETKAE
jgi:regulator of replication initiation timing